MLANQKFYTSLAIGAFLVFGCNPETARLTFAVGGASNEIEFWEKIIGEFTDSTGIEVIVLRQPTDTEQRRQGLVIPLRSRQRDPDIFLMDVIWVGQFVAADWLESLDSVAMASDIDLGNFFEPIIDQVDTYHDRLYALPVYNDCGLLYYRKDLLEKYGFGAPTTWQELIESAVSIQKKERVKNPYFYGFVWQGAQYEGLICNFLEFAVSNNGGIIDSGGSMIVHTAQNIEATKLMYDFIDEYGISPPNTYTEMKEEETRLTFERGNALYERNWPYAWGLHNGEESPVRGKVAVTVLPRANDGQHASTLGGWHIGISRFSDRKTEASMLLKFVLSYETQKNLALMLGWNPGRSDLYEDEDINVSVPHLNILKKSFENAAARPTTPFYTQISDVLQKHLSAVLSGESSPDEALLNAQHEIKETLKRYHE